MSAIPDSILSRTASVDERIVEPIPNSKKIYITGSRPDIRVPMREIACSPTQTRTGLEENTPITVYDTSGPYTDPEVSITLGVGKNEKFRKYVIIEAPKEAGKFYLQGPKVIGEVDFK